MPAAPHGGEDWRHSLLDASFRGAHFWVEKDGLDGGRRIVIHEFPLSEIPYNEDMGQQARRYKIDAYCVGGKAAPESQRLVQACTTPGPATLTLPLFGTMLARCLGISTKREKDKHGYVSFQLDFVADFPLSLGSMGGTPHLASRVRSTAQEVPPALREAVQIEFNAYTSALTEPAPLPEWALDTSVECVQGFALAIGLAGTQSGMRGDPLAALHRAVEGLYDNAPELILIGETGNAFGNTSYFTTAQVGDAEPLVSAITQCLDIYREGADPHNAMEGLTELSKFGGNLVVIPTTTFTRQAEKQNRESLLDLFHRSALAQYAQAAVARKYTSRPEAVAVRAAVAEMFNAELAKITDSREWHVYLAMGKLLGLTVEYLSRQMADLSPVIIVGAKRVLPSLYWAYRLYADPMRGAELWRRNQIKHPAYMPINFEALAR